MKFKIRLNISANDLYDFLIKSLNTPKVYEGLKIEKTLKATLNQDVKTILEVTKLEKDKVFELTYTSKISTNIVRYDLQEDSQGLLVIYTEKHISPTILGTINAKLIELLLSFSLKRKRKKSIKEVERYILDKKGSND